MGDSERQPTACPHLAAALGSLRAPRPSDEVHREECTLCFDDQDSELGIDVCLHCFNGSCARAHAQLHFEKTGHAIVVNVMRRPKPTAERPPLEPQPKKLAIREEREEDAYNWTWTPRCLACASAASDGSIPMSGKLQEVVTAVRQSLSSAQQSEVKAWEEEIVACRHTGQLQQDQDAKKVLGSSSQCAKCDMDSNLWLCLTCGNLGCGRAQYGGIGGHSHGLSHFEETGHPVSVKQGTITPEGAADIYCYACNDARLDPLLASHLEHLGINVEAQSKTEKSMTELQIEQNMKFDFSMTGEDGRELEPVFGPGLTGLRNLGNSCYMASVLQSVFSLAAFQDRYLSTCQAHSHSCPTDKPATCFECQMGKMADGLLSGRYSHPRPVENSSTSSPSDEAAARQGAIFQAGIRPSMLKHLVGKGHAEFSTMRQQDADEFFKHLISCIQKECKRLGCAQTGSVTLDPTNVFRFGLESRLQCSQCNKVRYKVEAQDAGISIPVPMRPIESQEGEKPRYHAVDLSECLEQFAAEETLEYHCPSCKAKVSATKHTRFTSFPDVLVVQARRFQLVGWVPQKVDVPIRVPFEGLLLDRFMGKGKQAGEEELPEDDVQESRPHFDEGSISQLTAMGFPELRCQKALLATGNSGDTEAAMNWLFSHMEDPDIDEPIDFSKASTVGAGASGSRIDTAPLEEMGFTAAQARKALRLNGNSADAAVGWLFENSNDPGEEDEQSADLQGGEDAKANVGGRSDLPARYRLQAFISHRGPSVHSGHYVAHVQRQGKDGSEASSEWIMFNDEKVVKAPFQATKIDEDASQTDTGVKGLAQLAYEYIFIRE